jgi:flagellar hook assembly protein FlgD
MLGQTIKTFNFDNISAGTHRLSWNSTDNFGNKVPAGVYLYQMETVDFIETKKMVLLK